MAAGATFDTVLDNWFPLTNALALAQSAASAHPDLYPYVLSPKAIEKLRLVHEVIAAARVALAGQGSARLTAVRRAGENRAWSHSGFARERGGAVMARICCATMLDRPGGSRPPRAPRAHGGSSLMEMISRSVLVIPLLAALVALSTAAHGQGITDMKKGEGGSAVQGSAGPSGAQGAASDLERCDKPMGRWRWSSPRSYVMPACRATSSALRRASSAS